MNQEAKDYLNKLLSLTPNELNAMQAAFLKARAAYLTDEQRAMYADVLGLKNDSPKMSDLREKAQEMGLTVPFGIKKEELIKLINNQ